MGQQYNYNNLDEYFDDVAIFGGIERTVRSENFRGGKIVAIFGGSKVNLNHVTLSPGPNVLEMVCIFGGSTLMIPPDWNVKLEVISIFGGMGDKRPPMPVDMNKTLIIKGVVLFGGGELKSY
jgi:predicted membrane protein